MNMHVIRPRKPRARTACIECQRRKQKCDQKQPCRYCLRRFPAVECTYSSVGDGSSTKRISNEVSGLCNKEDRLSESEIDHNSPSTYSSVARHDTSIAALSGPDLWNSEALERKPISLSVGSLESLAENPNGYQNLLSSMVSRISAEVISSPIDSARSIVGEGSALHSAGIKMTQNTSSLSDKTLIAPRTQMRALMANPEIPRPSNFSISLVDPLHYLGITPTEQSGTLFQAFIKLISKYVFSIDGNPGPNYYNDYWVPWSMKSPLLAYLGIFTAACYQAEAQYIAPAQSSIAIGFKLKTISILNDMLRSNDMSTSNEAIAGVVYLIVNEWYWSCFENVQAHMSGLREMIRLRGGLGEMGMNDFIRKIVILCDYYISCSHGCELSFPHNVPIIISCPPHTKSPFLYSQIGFASIAPELKIGKETASILDDMRFLIQATVKQTNREPTYLELLKLQKTSIWIRDRILKSSDGMGDDLAMSGDFLYRSCRKAALIYCKSIVEREPLSASCTLEDLNQLWATMWRITLSRWKEIPGIFLFIILSANPAAQKTPHGRLLKSMFKASSSYMALDNWEVVDATLSSYLKLQRWLGNGRAWDDIPAEPRAMEFMHVYQ